MTGRAATALRGLAALERYRTGRSCEQETKAAAESDCPRPNSYALVLAASPRFHQDVEPATGRYTARADTRTSGLRHRPGRHSTSRPICGQTSRDCGNEAAPHTRQH
jgi:hypothetical protein